VFKAGGKAETAMANHHGTTTSITHARLTEALPPLPLSSTPQLTISTQIPYHDDPADDDITLATLQSHLRAQLSPPGYEPMYDYLRSQQRPTIHIQIQPPVYAPSYVPRSRSAELVEERYRDEPFVVTILEDQAEDADISQPPPPSYTELYRQHEIEMQRLVRDFDTEDSPAEQTEELVKWVVAMLLVCLTIAGVGTAFNWGRPM
jgi:hypothetical protein